MGSTVGYFIGKMFGKKEQKNRCSFLWELEMEVSPRLLPKVIEREVKEGCISPDEADDRLHKILEVRQKYNLTGGFDVFAYSGTRTEVSYVPKRSQTPPRPENEAKQELLQQVAKQEVGPPSILKPKK